MDRVMGIHSNPRAVVSLIDDLKKMHLTDATLYVGYPILSTADHTIAVDGLLTSVEHGVIVFDLETAKGPPDWSRVEDKQAEIEIAIKSKLIKYKELTSKRNLAVPVHVVTYFPGQQVPPPCSETITVAVAGALDEAIRPLGGIDRPLIRHLNAAIQQVTTIKPQNKRLAVKNEKSRGGILKIIEREIANLDRWQKKGAIECPEGPQRIRGLAGSGKTVVLALKAAYLHAQHPTWTIVVSFHTRSLYGQFRDLIRRFMYEHVGDEPNWDKLRVMHSWGGRTDPGLYSEITTALNLPCRDFGYATQKYSQAGAFEGICQEALAGLQDKQMHPLYDALLLDEAQDFGPNFFQLAYASLAQPKRFVWAYDELQSLKETSIPRVEELFGCGTDGEPLVKLRNLESQPQQDIILPVCYRNTSWALSVAHALGFGVYRSDGLIQMFDEPSLWKDIGYGVVNGSLRPGSTVTLGRRDDATPRFFADLLNPNDAVAFHPFDHSDAQVDWVAEQIQTNLTVDELEPTDILVIFPDPVTVASKAGPLIAKLRERGILAHIAGVTRGPDVFFLPDSVTISGIHRAKGNEAPMVYLLNAEFCAEGFGLIRRRNILFTAITRSKAWVRVCGVGSEMKRLHEEMTLIQNNQYHLVFTVPTSDQLLQMRRIHRDRTQDEIQKMETARQSMEGVVGMLSRGEIAREDLPESLLVQLLDKLTPSAK